MNKQKKISLIIKIVLIVIVLTGGGYFGIKTFMAQDDADITVIAPDYSAVQTYITDNTLEIALVENVIFHATNETDTAIAGSAVTYWVELIGLDSAGQLTSVIVTDVKANELMPENKSISILRQNTINFHDTDIDNVSTDIAVSFCGQEKTFSYNVIQQNVDPENIAILVNTFTGVPSDFGPNSMYYGMEEDAGHALIKLIDAAKEAGYRFSIASDYRSYGQQLSLYNGAVSRLGPDQQDTAKPGYSEHQTGRAVDLTWATAGYGLSTGMEDDDEYLWLQENSYKYGFVLRYPNGSTDITGYYFEPWHYRYIGVELATAYHESGMETLDEFLSIPR